MPIFRLKNKVFYFSHIPKCGGSSIEDYLKSVTDVRSSFLDRKYYTHSNKPLTNGSPQHIIGTDIAKLFESNFFDEYFTVVRNPFERFISAFIFQKYIAKTIPMQIHIDQFINQLEEFKALHIGNFDNHFLPQTTFLYPRAPYRVFKFENGLDIVKKYIDLNLENNTADIPMPHNLKQPNKIKQKAGVLSEYSKKIISDVYKIDFKIFKY